VFLLLRHCPIAIMVSKEVNVITSHATAHAAVTRDSLPQALLQLRCDVDDVVVGTASRDLGYGERQLLVRNAMRACTYERSERSRARTLLVLIGATHAGDQLGRQPSLPGVRVPPSSALHIKTVWRPGNLDKRLSPSLHHLGNSPDK